MQNAIIHYTSNLMPLSNYIIMIIGIYYQLNPKWFPQGAETKRNVTKGKSNIGLWPAVFLFGGISIVFDKT